MKMNKLKRIALAASALVGIGFANGASAADVSYTGPGGNAQSAYFDHVFTPAAKVLGFEIEQDSSQQWQEARAQVESGSVTWDIINMNIGEVDDAVAAGILVKYPEDIVDASRFAPGTVHPYCIGNVIFSQIIGYNTEKWDGKAPTGAKDLFDTENFPGVRGFYRGPNGLLEAASIALGKSQAEIYDFLSTKEGLDAAFAKVEELAKSTEVIWWSSGAQLAQLHIDGQLDISYGWDGRIVFARQNGGKVDAVYQDGITQADCFAIVKGGPNTENAIELVREASKAEHTKHLAYHYPYGSVNLDAYKDYDDEMKARLTSSPQNIAGQFPLGVDFWRENRAAISERFDEMLIGLNQ